MILSKTAAARRYLMAIVTMNAAWLLLWAAIDWRSAQPAPQFFIDGIPLLAWYALGIVSLAGLMRWRSQPRPAFQGALALASLLVPLPVLLTTIGADYLTASWLIVASVAALLVAFFCLARGLRALTGGPQRAAAFWALTFVVAFVGLSDALNVIPDLWVPLEVEPPVASDEALADEEAILFAQAGRIDAALAAMGKDSGASPRAFFLGFAGVGEEKVFAQEIGLAARTLGQRFGIGGRSVALINDQRDLESAPLATVSGLNYALRGLGARMNLEEDVLFLAISSHGSEEPVLAVSNSELPLAELTDLTLAGALRDSKIKWRVIIISACYAGGFIESLKNPQTIVIAAAAADRTSFGCGSDSDLTYFGEAFYRDALPGARSLRDAFDKARIAIAARERREHVEASKPQAFFGTEIEAKLRLQP